MFFLLNLNIVAIVTLYEQRSVDLSMADVNSHRLSAIVYTSVSLALAAFIGIVLYHFFQKTAAVWSGMVFPKLLQWKDKLRHSQHLESTELQDQGQEEEQIFPSTTYVEIREPLIEQSI